MKIMELNHDWILSEDNGLWQCPADLPSDVNAELCRHKKIKDPHYDVQAREAYWITSQKWIYTKKFRIEEPFHSARLSFESVDGVCEVFLNDEKIGEMKNMFRRHRFDVGSRLIQGENTLKIVFIPIDELLGPRTDELAGWKDKRTLLRKPQYNFGWDWALPVPGIGLAGRIAVEFDYEAEITDYSIQTELSGRIDVFCEISEEAAASACQIMISFKGHGESFHTKIEPQGHRSYTSFKLLNPKLWWPNGYGDANLYEYQITLVQNGMVLQNIQGRTGIRKVEILEEPFTADAGPGFSFWLKVNGKRIFCKGGNWIPMELWPGMIRQSDYDEYLSMYQKANFDMIRVWGGGIYESERFYRLCDELGLLVWQDFMFASAAYPLDILRNEIIREADYQIRRLRNHACIALWCGCNEDVHSWSYHTNVMEYMENSEEEKNGVQQDTGVYAENNNMKEINRGEADYQLYTMILRGMTDRWGLGVPFIESSPMSRDDAGNMPNSGNSHISAWKYALMESGGQYDSWRKHFDRVCSFDSEFCDQGPCSMQLLQSFLKPENQWPPCDAWIYHIQKGHMNLPHYEQTLKIAGATFGEIDSLQKYVKYGQATHAEMMRSEFESARFDFPNNGGTMMWMFNDCWPTANWSIVDYTKHPKPSYYSARRSCMPVLSFLFERKNVLYAAISNQSYQTVAFKAAWGKAVFDGTPIFSHTKEGEVKEGETVILEAMPLPGPWEKGDYFFLNADINGQKMPSATYFASGWKNVQWPEPRFDFSASAPVKRERYYEVQFTVKAISYLRFFHIEPRDPLTMKIDDNYFDMTAGEQRILTAEFSDFPDLSRLTVGNWFTQWR